jgi:cell division septation protein DedD
VIGTPQPGTWVIQIHVLRDRTAANGIVRRLVAKGYPAFLVAAGPPTGSYKVQVGRYKDRDEAQKVIERLKKEEQFNPWITR